MSPEEKIKRLEAEVELYKAAYTGSQKVITSWMAAYHELALRERPHLIGYMGKSTRMVFGSGSRRHPNEYVAVYSLGEFDVERETDT